jgi:hypothetical protein
MLQVRGLSDAHTLLKKSSCFVYCERPEVVSGRSSPCTMVGEVSGGGGECSCKVVWTRYVSNKLVALYAQQHEQVHNGQRLNTMKMIATQPFRHLPAGALPLSKLVCVDGMASQRAAATPLSCMRMPDAQIHDFMSP